MPDKKLMYKSSPVDYTTTDTGDIANVTLVECWGKTNRRARRRTLDKTNREYVSGGGYSYTHHGMLIHDNTVYEVNEIRDERWWLRQTDWGSPEKEHR